MITDMQLQSDLSSKLQAGTKIDFSKIGITANSGIVTLSGRVRNQADKWSLVHAAASLPGARAIVNEIKVGAYSDEDIARAILNCIRYDLRVPEESIRIHVEQGWVILRGTVDHKQQRLAIENAVRARPGVSGLTSHIKVAARQISKIRQGKSVELLSRIS